jgi:hypothetical protein
MNLTKDIKDLYNENNKVLKNEIVEDTVRRKDFPRSWIGRINVKMITSTKSDRQSLCNPYQNSNDIPCRNRKSNPKVHIESQKTPNNQSNPDQNEQCWRY